MFVLLIATAIVVGGLGTYLVLALPNSQADQLATEQTPSITEEAYEEMFESFKESIELPKVVQAFGVIQDNYLNEVSDDQLIEGAIRGMLQTLEDPYSEYMDQETMEQFNEQVESSFEGIGAEVSMTDGRVTIVAPIKDSPAEQAGLRPNDQILSVDGESVEGLDLHEAVAKIRGEKGSVVTIEIRRPTINDPIVVDIVRDKIPLETVYSEVVSYDDRTVGIMQLTSFSETTADRFLEDLTDLEQSGIDGLVLDVRGNPGGLLPAIEDVLKQFITEDHPYMQIEDGTGHRERFFSSLQEEKDYPVSVLIDEGSASASEILAIALQETIDANVVGKTSFGKGTVQQTIPMGDGSTIKLTLFNWLSPKGTSIHEVGVEPTIEVEQPDYYYVAPIRVEEAFVYNDSDANIEFAQTMLEGLGYSIDRTDGYFSRDTETALKAFQTDHSLDASGELNEETANVLQHAVIDRIRSGEDDQQKQQAIEALFD